MPPGKASQSNAMLYTVITFVGMFIISTTCAVIFYVKSEEYKIQKDTAISDMDKFARSQERSSVAKLVGKVDGQNSVMSTLLGHIDELVGAVTGDRAEDVSAAEKVNNAKMAINKVLAGLGPDAVITSGQGNNVDLLAQIKDLQARFNQARQDVADIEDELDNVLDELGMAKKSFAEQEQKLIEDKNQCQLASDGKNAEFNDLKALMQQSTDEQVQTAMDRLEKAQNQLGEKSAQIQAVQTQLTQTDRALQEALAKLEAIKPRPDIEVEAFRRDARIIRVDLQIGIVYLDVGTEDRVYPGLTFSVYDSSVPIPEDGKGKAEIEIFDVKQKVSAARVTRSTKKNPIVPDDIIANLIWDSKTSNNFVVAGDFDFDRDGMVEKGGIDRVRELIERWGGVIVKDVTINTDFVILGSEPRAMALPSTEDMDANPSLQRRYEESVAAAVEYEQVMRQAESLSVPVFNQNRFLYMIGYETLADKSTPL